MGGGGGGVWGRYILLFLKMDEYSPCGMIFNFIYILKTVFNFFIGCFRLSGWDALFFMVFAFY